LIAEKKDITYMITGVKRFKLMEDTEKREMIFERKEKA
jgi:hypothetical protein